MKQNKQIIDHYLESLECLREADAPDHFYARLRARMEKSAPADTWPLPFRPAWLIGGLALLLVMNGFMLQSRKHSGSPSVQHQTGIMEFVNTYNQSLPSTY